MEQNQSEKWEGKASIDVPNTKADQAWSLLSNFCSLHLWLPAIDVCEKVAGVEDQPGCVRYCATAPGDGGEVVMWSKEELLDFDPVARSYCYEVTDNNIGFGRYMATFRVLEVEVEVEVEVEKEGGAGCKLEWSFESEPVNGWTQESLIAYLQTGLDGMAKRMEEALKAPPAVAATE